LEPLRRYLEQLDPLSRVGAPERLRGKDGRLAKWIKTQIVGSIPSGWTKWRD